MTRHHCPGDQCARCTDRIDAHEAGPLASDVEAATRWAEGEWTDWPAPVLGAAPSDPPSVRAFLGSTP